jgi:ribA/ribD-fused uncharacterized protein
MISEFKYEYSFLSNFASCYIIYQGEIYPSVENAYQAAKSLDPEVRKLFVSISAKEAKKLGRDIKIRSDWEVIKLDVMEELLFCKFRKEPFLSLLDQTGDEELVEGNWWGDVFWGVCQGVGENHLGRLLMEIREYNRA